MIDVMVVASGYPWLVSVGRDFRLIVWKFYKDRLIRVKNSQQAYLLSYEINHKDYVRAASC